MNQVQAERDAAKVLVEAELEEGLEPRDSGDSGHHEDGGPEEVEPFEVPGCLGG